MAQELRDKLHHNFIVNLLDGSFFGLGVVGLASYVTIIPLFLSYLTDSTALIGFMAALFHIGWQVPQLLTSNYVSGLKRYKPMVLKMTMLERLPYFGLAATALLIPIIGAELALALTILLLGWQSFAGGLTATAWQSMISKLMPAHRLGAFFGMQSAGVNFFGAGGALIASFILGAFAFPHSFALLFLIAAISLMVSFVFLAMSVEPESQPQDVVEQVQWREFGRRLKAILKQNANFRWFLIARSLTSLSVTAVSFFTIYGIRQYDMTPEFASAMTSVLLVSQTLSSTVIGWIGDRWGHRRVLVFGNLATVLSIVIALTAPDASWFYPVFALTGLVNATRWSAIMSITVQFGSVAERPIYIGMANTLIAPVTVFAPIIGGWLVDAVSFDLTFSIFALAGLLSMVVYLALMKDPGESARKARREAMAAAD